MKDFTFSHLNIYSTSFFKIPLSVMLIRSLINTTMNRNAEYFIIILFYSIQNFHASLINAST